MARACLLNTSTPSPQSLRQTRNTYWLFYVFTLLYFTMATSNKLHIDTLSNALGSVFLLPRICTLLSFQNDKWFTKVLKKWNFLWLFCFYVFEYLIFFYENLLLLGTCVYPNFCKIRILWELVKNTISLLYALFKRF